MKKIFSIIFVFFICNGAIAQTKKENNSDEEKNGIQFFDLQTTKDFVNPEYRPGTVVLFGDSRLNGFILLKDNSDIKFKQSQDSKEKITYYSRSIKSIILENEVFEYKNVKNSSDERKALKLEIDGDVMLYSDSYFRYMYNSLKTKKPEVHYYLGKKDQDEVLHIGFPNSYSKNFKKITDDYFGSCEALFTKINNREFERSDIQAIVNFYNNNCNKTNIDE